MQRIAGIAPQKYYFYKYKSGISMKSIKPKHFRVDKKIALASISTRLETDDAKEVVEDLLMKVKQKLSKKQDAMYAHHKHSFLICIQGMDTSGKDSLIREVFKEFNSRGVLVHCFKTPSEMELDHDFLWRHYLALPDKGKFSVFNRTHYENVLITRVHPEYLLLENLPGIEKVEDITPEFWEDRLESIKHFEKHTVKNGTKILKFFLHLSNEEQRKRLLNRLENAEDNWKFAVSDLQERERWEEYQIYYEEAINATSTKKVPWYVIPADDKVVARYIVAKIIWEELQKLKDIKEPELDPKIKANIDLYKEQLQ